MKSWWCLGETVSAQFDSSSTAEIMQRRRPEKETRKALQAGGTVSSHSWTAKEAALQMMMPCTSVSQGSRCFLPAKKWGERTFVMEWMLSSCSCRFSYLELAWDRLCKLIWEENFFPKPLTAWLWYLEVFSTLFPLVPVISSYTSIYLVLSQLF